MQRKLFTSNTNIFQKAKRIVNILYYGNFKIKLK